MLESAAKQREKRVVELDTEHSDDSMVLFDPQEVASAISELVPRIEQLNTVFERNLAVQSVESDKFMQLYQAHQHSKALQEHEIGELESRLLHSETEGKHLGKPEGVAKREVKTARALQRNEGGSGKRDPPAPIGKRGVK